VVKRGYEIKLVPLPSLRRGTAFAGRNLLAIVILSISSFPNFAFFPICASSLSRPQGTDVDARLAVFDDVWQTIYERYYDQAFNGVDWQGQREKFRQAAANARDTVELYAVLREMVRLLRDVHTRVVPPEQRSDWQRPRFITVGVSVREVEGSIVTVTVDRNSEAEAAGLRVGDIIKAIDGRPAGDGWSIAARTSEPHGGINSRAPARNIFDGSAGSSALIAWRDRNAEEHSAKLTRKLETREPSVQIRSINRGFAVVSFDAFSATTAAQLQQLMESKLSRQRGLVFDLRNNGGGDTESMAAIASMLLPAGTKLGMFFNRNGDIALDPQTSAFSALSARTTTHFDGPITILISERTSSAAEIFTSILQKAGRAKVVGQNSCGCVLAILATHSLPDGGALDVSELDYRTPAGQRLEGNGVSPDVSVPLTIDDIRNRRDRATEAAILTLRRK
jgi:carboxyl-terminal processing protease